MFSCAILPETIKAPYMSWKANKRIEEAKKWGNRRQHARAEAGYLEALQYEPTNVEALIDLGHLYLRIESYTNALKSYQHALRLDAAAYDAQIGIWATQLERGSLGQEVKDEVRKEIEAYIKDTPGDDKQGEYLYAAYIGLDLLHDKDRKTELQKRIMDLNPDEELLERMATYAIDDIFGESDHEKQLALINEFYSTFPSSKYIDNIHRAELRILADDLDDLDRLKQTGEKWLADEPDNRKVNFEVGSWFTEKGIELTQALAALEIALNMIKKIHPDEKPDDLPEKEWKRLVKITKGHYLDTLGWAFYKMNNYDEAKRMLHRASKILDSDPKLYYHLGALYEKLGKIEEAKDWYQKSLMLAGGIKEAESGLSKLIESENELNEEPHKLYAKEKKVTTFSEVTEKAKLSGINSGRVAWGDYNNDDYEDLLIDGSRLFRNNQDGTFTERTEGAGLKGSWGAVGGVWADFNNDGNLDFYMMTRGWEYSGRFWKNNGNGTFLDITQQAVGHVNSSYPTEGAGWGDYDGDGFVDLYLANYEKPFSRSIHLGIGTSDVLWKNKGDGTFRDVTHIAGMKTLEKMNGRGVNWGDFNNDGLLDVFVSNYRLDPNFLWRNNGDGTFTNVAQHQGVEGNEINGYYGHTIGSEWGDFNNDGDLDLFSANLAHPRSLQFSDKSMLYLNRGLHRHRFKEITRKTGIRYEETHSDPSIVDVDNDGDLDLYITAIYPKRESVLYRNNGDAKFEDITWFSGVRVADTWGAAFADYDRDGDLDLAVASREGFHLFSNDGNGNNWLHVKVRGSRCNRDGIGSRVVVSAGKLKQIREVQGGKGTGTEHSLPVEFGLGDYDGPIDLEVRNTCGQVIRRSNLPINQMITVGG